jgi:polyhydroxybutyrate depolymerase
MGEGAGEDGDNKPVMPALTAEELATELKKKRLKMGFGFIVIILIFVFAFAKFSGENYVVETMMFGGIERQYVYHGPPKGNGKQALVAVLHGYGGYAPDMIDISSMNDVADRHGFAVVYPFGTLDRSGKPFFNCGYTINKYETVDDAAFVAGMMQHASNLHNLHTENLFVSGFSNGGDLIYMLACRFPHVIKASVSVSGMMLEKIKNSDACMRPTALQASRAMPIMEVHGVADMITWWNGDMADSAGWGAYPSQETMINYWTTKHKCTKTTSQTLPQRNPQSDASKWGTQTTIYKHSQCSAAQGDAEVWFYKVDKGKHDWSSGGADYKTSADAWAFFEKYTTTSMF